MLKQTRILLFGLFAFASFTASAENIMPTCKIRPKGLDDFMMEYVVKPSDGQSIYQSHLPMDILLQLQTGTKEIRSRIEYNKATGILNNHLFLADVNSALPTSNDFNFAGNHFAWLDVKVTKVAFACRPTSSVVLVGTIKSGYPLFADPAGASYVFSFAYDQKTTDDTKRFNSIVSLPAGVSLTFKPNATGYIHFSPIQ